MSNWLQNRGRSISRRLRERWSPNPSQIRLWTLKQTLLGTLFTLVPWVAFDIFSTFIDIRITSPQQDLLWASMIFLLSILEGAMLLIVPFYFARRSFRSDLTGQGCLLWQALGFRRFRFYQAALWITASLFLILVVMSVYEYLLMLFHIDLQTNSQDFLKASQVAPLSTYAALLGAVFVAPFCEEVLFRGFLLLGLSQRMPVFISIISSSFIFAAAHVDLGSFIDLFVTGVALAFLRWRTNSIWPSVILHMLNNGVIAIAVILIMQGLLH